MAVQKHLTIQDRMELETLLCDSSTTISSISKKLNRDHCTIKREILKHRTINDKPVYGKSINNCALVSNCPKNKPNSYFYCNSKCDSYKEATCARRDKRHFCCNGCDYRYRCILTKYFYSSKTAQTEYEELLSFSREGINITEEELNSMATVLNSLVKDQGQSINTVLTNNPNEFNVCSKTIYNYVNMNLFDTRNIHLARKVRFSPRKSKVHHKIDRNCTIGRSYQDFLNYLKDNPGIDVVEGDSVEGVKGSSVLLTLFFRSCSLQLSFIRERNNASSVIDIFNDLYLKLGHESFTDLFPVILLDNGTEFSNPDAIENYYAYDKETGEINKIPRTKVFYCNPSAPYQKGACERNHEFIRLFIPKGKDFKQYTQDQINFMMNNINSYVRGQKKNFRCPAEKFLFQYGKAPSKALGIELIHHNDVVLNDSIFKK